MQSMPFISVASARRLGNIWWVNALSSRAVVMASGSQLLMLWLVANDTVIVKLIASSRNRC